MIEAVHRHGYQQATAREVCRLAAVSERAFYELFDRKQGCFLSTYDAIVQSGVERIGAAYRSEEGSACKLRAAFDAYAAEVVSEPEGGSACARGGSRRARLLWRGCAAHG